MSTKEMVKVKWQMVPAKAPMKKNRNRPLYFKAKLSDGTIVTMKGFYDVEGVARTEMSTPITHLGIVIFQWAEPIEK